MIIIVRAVVVLQARLHPLQNCLAAAAAVALLLLVAPCLKAHEMVEAVVVEMVDSLHPLKHHLVTAAAAAAVELAMPSYAPVYAAGSIDGQHK